MCVCAIFKILIGSSSISQVSIEHFLDQHLDYKFWILLVIKTNRQLKARKTRQKRESCRNHKNRKKRSTFVTWTGFRVSRSLLEGLLDMSKKSWLTIKMGLKVSSPKRNVKQEENFRLKVEGSKSFSFWKKAKFLAM